MPATTGFFSTSSRGVLISKKYSFMKLCSDSLIGILNIVGLMLRNREARPTSIARGVMPSMSPSLPESHNSILRLELQGLMITGSRNFSHK